MNKSFYVAIESSTVPSYITVLLEIITHPPNNTVYQIIETSLKRETTFTGTNNSVYDFIHNGNTELITHTPTDTVNIEQAGNSFKFMSASNFTFSVNTLIANSNNNGALISGGSKGGTILFSNNSTSAGFTIDIMNLYQNIYGSNGFITDVNPVSAPIVPPTQTVPTYASKELNIYHNSNTNIKFQVVPTSTSVRGGTISDCFELKTTNLTTGSTTSGIYMNNIFTTRDTTVVNVGTELNTLKTHIERLESIITNLVNQQFTDMTAL